MAIELCDSHSYHVCFLDVPGNPCTEEKKVGWWQVGWRGCAGAGGCSLQREEEIPRGLETRTAAEGGVVICGEGCCVAERPLPTNSRSCCLISSILSVAAETEN